MDCKQSDSARFGVKTMNIEITIHLFSAIVWTLWVTFGLLALLASYRASETHEYLWNNSHTATNIFVALVFAVIGVFLWKQIIEMETENG